MSVQLLRRSFTVDEYHRMAEARIFGEDDRVELIEGEIVGSDGGSEAKEDPQPILDGGHGRS